MRKWDGTIQDSRFISAGVDVSFDSFGVVLLLSFTIDGAISGSRWTVGDGCGSTWVGGSIGRGSFFRNTRECQVGDEREGIKKVT
jgi:hypothetical protein